MCGMARWFMCAFCSVLCVTWLVGMCDMTQWCVWHDSLICVTWLVDTCDMIQSRVWHDSLICVTCLVYMCNMTRWYVRHASLMCHMAVGMNVTFLVDVWHDSLICVTWFVDWCAPSSMSSETYTMCVECNTYNETLTMHITTHILYTTHNTQTQHTKHNTQHIQHLQWISPHILYLFISPPCNVLASSSASSVGRGT